MLRPFRHRAPSSRKALLAAIHATAKDLGMPDDIRRDMQRQQTGQESCKDMTMPELTKVYGALSLLATAMGKADRVYMLKKRAARPGRDERLPQDPLSIEQNRMIQHLFEHVGLQPGPQQMNHCRKVIGGFWPQSREQGNKVIESLKAMQKRGWHAGRAVGT